MENFLSTQAKKNQIVRSFLNYNHKLSKSVIRGTNSSRVLA